MKPLKLLRPIESKLFLIKKPAMKILSTILTLSLSACLLYSCNSNSAANGSPGSSISSGVTGSGDDYYYESTVATTGKEMSMNEFIKSMYLPKEICAQRLT